MEEKRCFQLNSIIDNPSANFSYESRKELLTSFYRNLICVCDVYINIPNLIFDNNDTLRNNLIVVINSFNSYYDITCIQKFFVESSDIFNILYFLINIVYILEHDRNPDFKLLLPVGEECDKEKIKILYEQSKENLIYSLSNTKDEASSLVFRIIYTISNKQNEFETRIKEFEDKVKEAEIRCIKTADKAIKEIETAKEKFGLSEYAGSFATIASEETTAKRWWLIVSIVFGISAIFILGVNLYDIYSKELVIPLNQFVQKALTSIFLFIAAFWCSRKYYISRNQEISYRHIAAILKAYSMFKSTAPDAVEQQIIITEMAHAIFTLPKLPSAKCAENSDFTKMIELLKIFKDYK